MQNPIVDQNANLLINNNVTGIYNPREGFIHQTTTGDNFLDFNSQITTPCNPNGLGLLTPGDFNYNQNKFTKIYGNPLIDWSYQENLKIDLKPNSDEIVIDLKLKEIRFVDFTGNLQYYKIEKLETKCGETVSDPDSHVIIASREISVKEIKLLKEKTLLLEFCDSTEKEDRYGKKYIPFAFNFSFGNTVINAHNGLISNDIVSIQPMSPPIGQLLYFDYVYNNGIANNNIKTHSINPDNCVINSDGTLSNNCL